MATQLLNADADITIIQDLLGHSRIATTQRYCRVSNHKVQRDYYRAMEVVMSRTGTEPQPRAAHETVTRGLMAVAQQQTLGFIALGNQEGQGKRKAESTRPCPSVIPPPRRSGRSPALPYPPGGQNSVSSEKFRG